MKLSDALNEFATGVVYCYLRSFPEGRLNGVDPQSVRSLIDASVKQAMCDTVDGVGIALRVSPAQVRSARERLTDSLIVGLGPILLAEAVEA